MNFDTTEEQELLQATVRQFAENECPPTRVRDIFDGETGHDPALWTALCELGLGGIHVSDEFGGAGLDRIDVALTAEVLGAMAVPGPFLSHAVACEAIQLAGSDAQKKSWLPRLASGESIGTFAFAESEGGSWQPGQWSLAGSSTLTGTKRHVPGGQQADVLVVGTAGGGLGLVEAGASGVEIKDMGGVDRTRRLSEVTFSGAACELLPGGVEAATRVRDLGLALLCADAYGGAWKCVEMAVEYALTREQFGVKIATFQALKHQLADMAVEAEPCRALYWYAAHALDALPDEAERACAIAKGHVTDRYMQVARDTVEAHGGIGFTWECDVQIYFKRAMFDRAMLGAPAEHRERAAVLGGW